MCHMPGIHWFWTIVLLSLQAQTRFGLTRANLKASGPGAVDHNVNSMNYRVNMPTVYVLENATVGSVILSDIRAHLGLPTTSLVKLGPGSLNQFFRLDSDSGRLVTVAPLDLESTAICQAEKLCCRQEMPDTERAYGTGTLTGYGDPMMASGADISREIHPGDTCRMMAFILSRSGTDNQLTPITRLYVTVVDLNDNAPVFRVTDETQRKPTDTLSSFKNPIPTVKLAFSEGAAGLHSRHDLPTAFDADFSLINRVKRYWLEWNAVKDSMSSDLTEATHHGGIPNVLSIDDQNGLTWATLGPFRLIYLEPGRSIALELDGELDRELQHTYQLRLVAEDGGGLRGQMLIDIDVLDVNEYAPVFADDPPTKEHLLQQKPRSVYRKRYSVKESLTVGTELGQLRAYDADQSPGNAITYRLGPGNPPNEVSNTFQINPITGVLKLAGSLDYESTQQYRLTVIAQDGPGPDGNQAVSTRVSSNARTQHTTVYRSATAIVEIIVIDVNDNAPTIRFDKEDSFPLHTPGSGTKDALNTLYEVWIKEDLPKGSPVTFFSVSDRDLAENGRVTCGLMNWTERFRLREFTGLYGVETLDEFDREKVDTYHVTIRCHDHGIPVLQTDRTLVVHLEDVNDLPPKFQLPVYQFHVLENSPPGTPLKPVSANFPNTIKATDPDLNSTIKYHLESRPVSQNSLSSIMTEIGSVGSGVTDHQLFHINPVTGLLTTQGELDREERARLSFQACADDGKHVTCADVIVLLDDVNDNRPRFDRDTYVVRVEENQLSHKPILTFRVTDADTGNHGFVYDFLEENLPTFESKHLTSSRNHTPMAHDWEQFEPGSVRYHFALRENTLYVRRPLDRELRSNYHFFVTVTDLQDPLRSQSDSSGSKHSYSKNLTSKAEIFIDVGDVNDNAPIFIFPNSTGPSGNRLSISCHETMGSSVGRIQASDPDLGPNATVVFSLIHTPEVDQLFYLDAQSGELFVNTGQLADKCGDSLIMVVSVDDQGPVESKKSRPTPVERMLIKMEDKPTLAELIASEARQQWRVSSEGSSDGRTVKLVDGSGDNALQYGTLSTRTILSVVLGGSTVFLIGLLIVWLILLLYNRSRRRKRPNGHRIPNKSHFEPGSTRSALSADSPDKSVLFGTLNSGKNENQFCDQQFVRNVVQNDQSDTVAIHQTSVPVEWDYYRCVADREIGYITSKDPNYGKFAVRIQASPTSNSRISTSPQNAGAAEMADYSTTRGWQADRDHYHTCVPEQYRVGMTTPATHSTLRRSPGGMELATISRDPKTTSTFGRLLPRWIVNNIVPRSQTNKDVYPYGKEACILSEKQSMPHSVVNNTGSLDHRSTTLPLDLIASPQNNSRFTRTLEKHGAPRSSPGCSTRPSQSTIAYTSLRPCTMKQPSDRFPSIGLNNQSRNARVSYPFLTPPAKRRTAPLDGTSQIAPCMTKGDYTSLLRPTGTVCGPEQNCPARPSSSIPMLNYSECSPPPSQTDPSRTAAMRQQNNVEHSHPHTHRLVATSIGQLACSMPNSYPCCSACEPRLPSNSSLLGSCDLLSQVGDHTADSSIQNCPQCRMMGASMLQPTCCADNCSLLQTAHQFDSAHPTGAPLTEPGDGLQALNMSDPQCSNTAYMSMQEMLNSCV